MYEEFFLISGRMLRFNIIKESVFEIVYKNVSEIESFAKISFINDWRWIFSLVNTAGVFICHHEFQRFLDKIEFPERSGILKFLSFLWNEVWEDVLLAISIVMLMENSFKIDVSELLVEVNGEEEFT